MDLPDAPVPEEGFLVTHFLTVADQGRSRDFYAGVLGGQVVAPENPCIIKLANSWVILNSGGGPTPDKPDVSLEPPRDTNRVNSFLNLRVADAHACYATWKATGAEFLTEPLDNHGWETRCYMRDPDGYIIEVGQPSQKMVDLFAKSGAAQLLNCAERPISKLVEAKKERLYPLSAWHGLTCWHEGRSRRGALVGGASAEPQ